jgi:hypothetical protein
MKLFPKIFPLLLFILSNFCEAQINNIFSITSFKKNIEVDERYFQTIIPNSRLRLENKKSYYFKKLVYLVPAIIIGIFFIYRSSYDDSDVYNNLPQLIETIYQEKNLTDELFSNILEYDENVYLENGLITSYFEDHLEIDESVFEYIEENLTLNEINSSLINELSENEFNGVYSELIKNGK